MTKRPSRLLIRTGLVPIPLPCPYSTQQNIQYLDVTETRTLVIFKAAILNLESNEGTLTTLSGAEITVYELPRHTNTDDPENEASSVIEKFIDQITSAEMTTASRHE